MRSHMSLGAATVATSAAANGAVVPIGVNGPMVGAGVSGASGGASGGSGATSG